MRFTPRKFVVVTVACALVLSGSIGTALAARSAGGGGVAPVVDAIAPQSAGSAGSAGASEAAAAVPAPFTDAVAFATKTGFRGVVTWSASSPVAVTVRWGLSPDALDQSLVVPDAPDTAGVAVIDQLEIGTTYYVSLTDAVSGAVVGPLTLVAANAYNNYDEAAGTYTLNALVQLDSQSLPADVPADQALADIAQGVNVFAERVYDALDGHARLGHILVTDTQIAYAVNEPFAVEETFVPTSDLDPCGADRNLADVLIQTSVPFDSHTFLWAIDEPCTSFYVGREGQLVVPWTGDLHFGYVATHEMLHYAFGAPDLYDPAETGESGCRNLEWDGSLMHNTGGWAGNQWILTELDRSPEQTPCDHQHDEEYSWDALQERYTRIPDGPLEHIVDVLPRGNEDGGALAIRVLDRGPGSSTLTPFTPNDANPDYNPGTCSADNLATTFTDPVGDATVLLGVNHGVAAAGDPALDVVSSAVDYNDVDGDGRTSMRDTISFTIGVDDLKDTPPTGSHGEYFDYTFTMGSSRYYAAGSWDRLDPAPTFELGRFAVTRSLIAPVTGTWDVEADEVTIIVPAIIQGPTGAIVFQTAPGARVTGFTITTRRLVGRVIPDADVAGGGCPLTAPAEAGELPPPPAPPSVPTEPNATLAGGDRATLTGTVWQTNSNYVDCYENFENPRCNVFLVEVTATGVLELDVTGPGKPLEDYDIYLYDGERTGLMYLGAPGPAEAIAFPVEPGRYYVQVIPYDAAAGSQFTLGLTMLGASV